MAVWNAVRHPAVLRILAAVTAGAIVAAGAAGVGLLLPPARLAGAWPWALRLGGIAAAGCGLAILLRQRARTNRRSRSDPTLAALATAATIMCVLTVLALLAPRATVPEDAAADRIARQQALPESGPQERDPSEFRPAQPRPNRAFPATGEGDDPGGSGFGGVVQRTISGGAIAATSPDWRFRVLLLGIVLGVAALIGLFVLWRRRGSMDDGIVDEPPISAEEAEAGLESSLEEVSYEGPDPRRQITAAYHRLLAALAEAGAPREPQEAPHEHLNRILGPLGVRSAPMHRLAELYVIAQFSTRALADADRAAAADALSEALADLRAAHRIPIGRSAA